MKIEEDEKNNVDDNIGGDSGQQHQQQPRNNMDEKEARDKKRQKRPISFVLQRYKYLFARNDGASFTFPVRYGQKIAVCHSEKISIVSEIQSYSQYTYTF